MKRGVNMDFGTRLKELRLQKKLTQEELGKIVHVSKVSISGYERGGRNPDRETLTDLADYFGVSTDYLLGRSNIPTPDKSIKNNMNDADLDKMLDEAMSFDGKPMNDHDRELIRAYLKGQFANRDK